MTDSRIAMSDMHEPLHERTPPPKSVSLNTLLLGLALVMAAGLVIIGFGQHQLFGDHSPPPDPTDPLERAVWLMTRHPLIDGHNDLAWQFRLYRGDQVWSPPAFDLARNQSEQGLQTDIPKIQAGHLGGQFFSVYVRCNMSDAVRATMEQIDTVKAIARRYSSTFQLAYSAADIQSAFAAGKVASLLGIEGGHSIDSSVGTLRQMYELGVRYMTLTHNCNTPWAESCCDPMARPTFPVRGLTRTEGQVLNGVQVVREMNRIGMIVDLSHTSLQTQRDALNVSTAPVIFSHSAVYSLVPNERNVRDEIIDALQRNGGLLMVTFFNDFVWPSRLSPNTVAHVADHIDYIRKRTGSVDNIGVGSDFDGNDAYAEGDFPQGLKNVSGFPNLFAELLRRGYSDADVIAILGGNLLRVMSAVQQHATDLQNGGELVQEHRLLYNNTCRSDF